MCAASQIRRKDADVFGKGARADDSLPRRLGTGKHFQRVVFFHLQRLAAKCHDEVSAREHGDESIGFANRPLFHPRSTRVHRLDDCLDATLEIGGHIGPGSV